MQVPIYEIAKEIHVADDGGLRTITTHKQTSVADGLKPTKFIVQPNKTYRLKPSQTLSAQIDRFHLTEDGRADGYQRHYSLRNINAMARDMRRGDVFPAGTAALNPDGSIDLVDGQQRAIASVIADVPFRVEVLILSQAQRVRFYDKQGDGLKIKEEDRVLRQTGPVADYLRAAYASTEHTWHPLLLGLNSAQSRWVLASWALKQPINSKNSKIGTIFPDQKYDKVFVPAMGDELAALLKTWGYGPKHEAVGGYQSKAVVSMAIKALAAAHGKTKFQDRWNQRMHLFEWDKALAEYRSHRSNDSRLLEIPLQDHWNWNLPLDSQLRIK